MQRKLKPQVTPEIEPQVEPVMTKSAEDTRHEFFSLILGAKLVGHILHLQEPTFAGHIALDEFYKGAQKTADKIIEVYQGAANHIVHYIPEFLTQGYDSEPLSYLGNLRKQLCDTRYDVVPKEISNVHNEIDNFITLIDTAVYKITFLK